MHAKVFSIQIFQYFRQIPLSVCTLVLFIRKTLDQATNFFRYSILPELLGKFYSRLPTQETNEPEAACESEPLSVPHLDQNARENLS